MAPTRRQLLGGAGAAGGAALTGWFKPTWLPDPLTDLLIEFRPDVPERLYRAPVSAAHADEAVEELAAVVERANALRERIDVDSLPERLAFHLDNDDPSGGWLESAREERVPHERLFAATYGMQFAGEVVGYARAALDEVDTDLLADRAERLRTEARAVRDSISEYRVSDPGRDLAPLFAVETELSLARLNANRDWSDVEEYNAGDVAGAWGSHVQAAQYLRNARHYREGYRGALGADPTPLADRLADAHGALVAAAETFPTREAMRTEIEEERDLTQETPYGAARWELFTLCYDNDFRFGFEEGYRSGHRLQAVVTAAEAVLARRAHEFALRELGVGPGDSGYDGGRALRAKRRAVRTFRSVRADRDSAFAGVVAERPAGLIRAGEVGLDGGGGSRPAWQNRVEASVYYLVGAGMMRELGGVLGTVLPEA